MKTSKTQARKGLGKAVELTRSEIEDALRAVESGGVDVVGKATDTVAKGRDLAGDTVAKSLGTVTKGRDKAAKGRSKAVKTSRKAKRRATKARRRIEKALPDLPVTGVVTRRSKRRSKKPLALLLLIGLGGAAFSFLRGSK